MFRKSVTISGLGLILLLLLLGWFSSLSASSGVNNNDVAKVPPADASASAIMQISPDELEPSTRSGNMQVSTETGQPLALFAVNYAVAPGTPEEMARQYLAANAPLLHLQSPDLSDLAHTFTRLGPSGPTVRFQQVVNGIPVYKSEVVVHLNNKHTVTYVINDYKSTLNSSAIGSPTVTAVAATESVRDYLGVTGKTQVETTELMFYVLQGQTYLVYRVNIVTNNPLGDWEAMVDANSGEFLKLVNQSLDFGPEGEEDSIVPTLLVTGTGNVFDPDPLSSANATYGDTGFTDNNDATSPQLDAELMSVPLRDISFTGGMYHLDGPYAAIRDTESPFFGLFSQASSDWNYNRFDNAFEAANTYYHIDSSMRYLNETLGLNIMPYQYSGGVRFDPHGLSGADNSHYSTGSGEVAFGEGGVDDAEDSDVIHHELGHGLHDWVTNGGLSQVNGLSEGSGDYWAQSYNRSLGYWQPSDPPYQWVFNWDGHNPFWPGRVTNYPALYPGGLTGQIHTDGQIWSTCNMRVYDAIGQQQMDRAFWEGLGMTTSSTNQEVAANAVYQAAIDMGYSASEIQDMHDIYLTCVYVVPDVPLADFGVEVTPETLSVCTPDNAEFTVDVTDFNGFGTNVVLSASGQPNPPNTAVFSVNNQLPPYSSTLTIGTNGAAAGDYALDVVGMSPTTTHTTTVQLMVAESAPGTATLLTPTNMATGISITPDFTWNAVAGAASYYLEVADDINFTNIIYTADVNGTSHTLPGANALDYLTWHYWRVTASNACGSGTTSAPFSFQTVEQPNTFCSSPNLSIPDSGSVNDTISIGTNANILDVDIYVDVPHTWVGDLIFTVNHNSTNAIIIDRPGYSGAGFGCSGNDYDVTVNDEGPDGNIESQCADAPAIFGDRVGGDPPNNSLLAAYDGMDINGDWTLTISDNAGGDIGTLVQWCVVPTLEEGGPGVDLSPNQADSGAPGSVVTYTMNVTNTGNAVDTFDLTADAQWDTQLSESEITLNAGEVGTFTAAVTVPADALADEMGTSQITATSQNDGSVSDDAFLMTTATAVYGITVNADPPELSGEAGAVLTYTVHLTNTGNTTDTFSLSTLDDNGWMSHVEPVSVTLAAGEMGSVMVMVHVPHDAADGEMNVTTVTAVSDTDAAATAAVDLTSTAGAPSYMIYLPIILKP